MLRKTRRKIRRKERGKRRHSTRIPFLDTPMSNRETRLSTYFIMLFEAVFVIWWIQETILSWQELIIKFSNIFNIIGRWF